MIRNRQQYEATLAWANRFKRDAESLRAGPLPRGILKTAQIEAYESEAVTLYRQADEYLHNNPDERMWRE